MAACGVPSPDAIMQQRVSERVLRYLVVRAIRLGVFFKVIHPCIPQARFARLGSYFRPELRASPFVLVLLRTTCLPFGAYSNLGRQAINRWDRSGSKHGRL